MALEPDKTTWNPNRYKATEYVITYDASGNAQLTQKAADYTGVSYNFSQLPANNTQNTTTTNQNHHQKLLSISCPQIISHLHFFFS